MTQTENIADRTLHFLGRTGFRPSLVVIGAMDGVSFDDFHGYICKYRWPGLFVEPNPEQFERLKANYAERDFAADNRYENSAIADYDGRIRMLTIRQEAIDRGEVHPCFAGMSAIYPPRNGLASAGDAPTVEKYGEMIEVSCLTLATLFERHRVEHLDVLCIDAEGWDYRILRQLDFARYRPKLLRCEWINLTPDEQAALVEMLTAQEYRTRIEGQDLDAVPNEFWAEIQSAGPSPAVDTARSSRPRNVTLVTAMFDLSSEESDLALRHDFAVHLDHCKRLLQVDWPMVVFTQPELAETVRRWRSAAETYVVTRPLSELRRFPFYDQVQKLRQTQGRVGRRALPLYNPFAMSKQFFLNDAAIYDPFKTDFFLWVDPDIADAIGDPVAQFSEECQRNLTSMLNRDRILYLASPLEADDELPGLCRATMADLLGEEPAELVRGRLFGGSASVLHEINGVYYDQLSRTLDAGWMGTEEHVLTLVAAGHGHLCHVHTGRGLRELFESLQHGVPAHGFGR
jgi:FkbM family methyltransferase